ncbi:hypothetical protein Ocin01_08231 [Orchesella cincta]|uniref:Uncharacterized protein n=1 Tax=Orchesella cincta TaxID=48709 RepID=A0A1D2N0L1_ORCCI|nr:hypothetical protein Ocin01_08231 [Orchesella cincta]
MASSTSSISQFVGSLNEVSTIPFLALSLLPVENVEGGIFSRITMTSMTSAWYLPLSHFEALFVGLAILEIMVMRYFLILPLDVTKLIEDGTLLQTSVSRKKRMAMDHKEILERQRLAETMFTIIRRIDKDDCVLRTLCELEFSTNNGMRYGHKLTDLLSNLKRLGLKRIQLEGMSVPNNVTVPERKVLSVFEEAVLLGDNENDIGDTCKHDYGDSCASQYSLCKEDTSTLLGHVQQLDPYL